MREDVKTQMSDENGADKPWTLSFTHTYMYAYGTLLKFQIDHRFPTAFS